MRHLLALFTIMTALVLTQGCSKCSRDPEPPVPATEPAAVGPEEMNNNPGLDQPGANDPTGSEADDGAGAPGDDESAD